MDIKPHTVKKHRALGCYLGIVKDLISSPKTPFKKLYYADLYCGDGECDVEQIDKHYESNTISSLLKPALQKNLQLFVFLNDANPDNIKKIQEKTKDYSKFIVEYGNEDANTYYKKVLQKTPIDQLSIFFLDPTNHSHLKWTTIESISKHTHQYKSKFNNKIMTRRPELIINLMLFTMFGSYMAKDYQSINESLGTNEWQKKVDYYKKLRTSPAPIESALIDTFVEQLKKLGYSVTTPLPITGTSNNNIVYCLIWATNESGYKIIERRLTPYLNRLIDKTQRENEDEIKRVTAKRKGDVPLNKWFNP